MRTTPAPSRHDMKLHGILDGMSGDWQPTNVVVASCRENGPPKCIACPMRMDGHSGHLLCSTAGGHNSCNSIFIIILQNVDDSQQLLA